MIENEERPFVGSARNAARALLKKCGITTAPVYLRTVVQYLQQHYPLRVVGWNFGSGPDGILTTIGDEAAIGYNNNTHWHRQRFTVAHEIGHFYLGHTQPHSSALPGQKTPWETEAQKFAAELLMPLAFLKKDIQEGTKTVKALATRYLVSEHAMWIRVEEGRLLSLISKS